MKGIIQDDYEQVWCQCVMEKHPSQVLLQRVITQWEAWITQIMLTDHPCLAQNNHTMWHGYFSRI